jgi:peptide/nickel transport system substrate-binding protein
MHRQLWYLTMIVAVVAMVVLSACATPIVAPTAVPTAAAPKVPLAPTAAPQAPAVPTQIAVAPTAVPPVAAPTNPAPQPTVAAVSKYREAPQLAELVKSGKLPAVDQRLPDEPLVVPVIDEVGQYGGVWRRGFLGPNDANNYVRVIYDALVRFSPDGSTIEPKIASGWEASKDYSAWTIKLRKGAKWSDGVAFNADDIMFWYNDVLLNKDLMPSIPSWMKNQDGSTAVVDKIDDYSVRWSYKNPATFFLAQLANLDGGDRSYAVFLPAHYLKKFHPKYTPQADIDKLVADAKLPNWGQLFATKNAPPENPDRPTMGAWAPATRVSEQIFQLKRNPYYIGVDKDGNQLPYLDEVQFKFFADAQALNLAVIAGELDMQERHISLANYPLLKENALKGKYQVITWPSFGGSDATLIFNQTFFKKDAEIGGMLANRDFRIALSYAINRDQIKESAFLGVGEARQPVPAPWHPFYPGDAVAKKFTEFNPTEANRLLDSVGLSKKDAEGFRLLPSGKRAVFELSVVPGQFGPWGDVAQLVAKDWEKVGVKINLQLRDRTLHFALRDSNDIQVEMWNNDTTAYPFTGNANTDVRVMNSISLGPLYRQWYNTSGKEGVEPTAEIKKLAELTDQGKSAAPDQQAKIAKDLFTLWVDQEYQVGTVGLTPMVQGVVVFNNAMRNIPKTLGNDFPLRTPGNARTEQFYFKK